MTPSATTSATPGLSRALELLEPPLSDVDVSRGYLDLLHGRADPTAKGPGPALMNTWFYPLLYSRFRNALGAAFGRREGEETQIQHDLLALAPGDLVLDVACGPANFSGAFARAVGPDGLVVGIDASKSMIEEGVRKNARDNLALIRGDAGALPFRDGTFDAICCWTALQLMADPFGAIDEMTRVLQPGGRVAFMATRRLGVPVVGDLGADVAGWLAGMTFFATDDLTRALAERGFVGVTQRVLPGWQFVGGVRE